MNDWGKLLCGLGMAASIGMCILCGLVGQVDGLRYFSGILSFSSICLSIQLVQDAR